MFEKKFKDLIIEILGDFIEDFDARDMLVYN
jgi:hypothetical protein